MSTGRPAPRKSALAGASPLIAPKEQVAPMEAMEEKGIWGEGEPTALVTAPAQTSAVQSSPAPAQVKVSFYLAEPEAGRLRSAVLHTMAQAGHFSLSDFLKEVSMHAVEELESKYNKGEPFPQIGERGLPRGRRAGT